MSAYIKTDVCCSCDAARTERETGAGFCAYGDFDHCEYWRQAQELSEIAGQVAAKFRKCPDAEMRRELAIATADGFANALYVQGKGAEFDCEAFIVACGLALHEAVA